MTRAEQPTAHPTAPDDALVADSRERAVRSLLRRPQLRRLWSAQLVSGVGDTLSLLVLVLLVLQAAIAEAPSAVATEAWRSQWRRSSPPASSPRCSSAPSSSAR